MSFQPNGELVPVGGGDSIPLVRPQLTLGRRDSCDICLRFPNVSGLHAQLTFQDGYWRIRDMNSTNGVKVNGTRVIDKLLHPDDEITIAKRKYVIHYELPAARRAMEELEDDVMAQSLLERAGLQKHKPKGEEGRSGFDAADFLLADDDED
jgi:adenylate cyclase